MSDELIHRAAQKICCVQCRKPDDCYAGIFREQAKAIVSMTLDEAAKACDAISQDVWTRIGGQDAQGWMVATAKDCAAAIRALKGEL